MNPKWDCGSASYYSRLTDTNYEKVKSKLKAKLKEGNPPKVTISTYGWTQVEVESIGNPAGIGQGTGF